VKRTLAAFSALFLLSALLAFPQGSFLKTGQSGLGVSGALITNPDVSGFTGTAGLALSGIFDLSLSLGRASYDPAASGDLSELKARSLVTEIRAYFARQDSGRSPVTASIAAGFASDKFSSPDFVPDSLVMRSHSLLIGATVCRNFPLFKKAFLQPYVGVGYASTTTKISNPSGYTVGDTDGVVALNLGVPLVYSFSAQTLLVLQPGVALDKNNVTFAVSVGLVVALSRSKAGA
jgi:opacity protein-like surface antigen